MTANPYHRLSIVAKRSQAIARIREPALRCRWCSMQVMPADMQAHREQRCSGRPNPGPGAKWIVWREAVAIIRRAMPAMDEPAAMMRLSRWSRPDREGVIWVRPQGTRGGRKYLHSDLVDHLQFVVGTNKSVSEGT